MFRVAAMSVLENTYHLNTHIQNDVGVDASRSEVRLVSIIQNNFKIIRRGKRLANSLNPRPLLPRMAFGHTDDVPNTVTTEAEPTPESSSLPPK